MNSYTSPVPIPALDATAPEVYREIYGMPMFVTIPTADLAMSKDFWIRGLGFIDLFSAPGGQVTHLRRWAFQDVLLVPGVAAAEAAAQSISFACVLGQLDEIAARCSELVPGCTDGPELKPWNSVELTLTTPENAVGLVRPSVRTLAGYRVCSGDDIARIHQVLVYRELGLPLGEIGRLLDDPAADAREHLRRQRAQLTGGRSGCKRPRTAGASPSSGPSTSRGPAHSLRTTGARWLRPRRRCTQSWRRLCRRASYRVQPRPTPASATWS